jgi:hypothetical protein
VCCNKGVCEVQDEKDKYVSMYQEAVGRVIPEAKELSKVWHDNLTKDYWLLYYLLKEFYPGNLEDLSQETIKIAYNKMIKDEAHIRGNEIRPIMNCHGE